MGAGVGALVMALLGAGLWKRRRQKAKDGASSPLLGHPFFGSMHFALVQKVKHLPIDRLMRRAVFRDLLQIKLEIWLDRTCDWVKSIDDEQELSDFEADVYSYLARTVRDYEDQILQRGIPPVVLKLFREWHATAISHIQDFVREVCRCSFYEANQERATVILTALDMALCWTLVDAGRALGSLNGQLDGIMYKGLMDHCATRSKCETCIMDKMDREKK